MHTMTWWFFPAVFVGGEPSGLTKERLGGNLAEETSASSLTLVEHFYFSLLGRLRFF